MTLYGYILYNIVFFLCSQWLHCSIKARSLTLEDLHDIWNAQIDQHEAIVKNVHDLLAKLAWDFSPEQLDHLFECFQKSWSSANVKQREKLLELIRRLAEDDKVSVPICSF